MTTISRSAIVPYSTEQMYVLVNDINSYPQFLPWCRETTILSQSPDEVTARVTISKGGLNKSFTTRNRLLPNKMIEMRLILGPLHHLEGFWCFQALSDSASKVSLDIDFEFSNRILSKTMGPLFNYITITLVDAFTKRAQQVYA